MPTMNAYAIETSKEALKFSAAHLATFADGSAERLHGHNYQVCARLEGELDKAGMVLDACILKQWVRELCDELDEHMLIAMQNPLLQVEEAEDEDEVVMRYKGKTYVFPSDDCVLLAIPNTTMEYLARYLAERLHARLDMEPAADRMRELCITVSETPGQSASWTLRFGK
jgi:6-pyruvoyltetrahydropterin/6-carboxytetrahydropterin synthase